MRISSSVVPFAHVLVLDSSGRFWELRWFRLSDPYFCRLKVRRAYIGFLFHLFIRDEIGDRGEAEA